MRVCTIVLVFVLSCLACLSAARASGGECNSGGGGQGGGACHDAGAERDNPEAEGIPLACDGSLCDTTNSSTITDCACGVAIGSAPLSATTNPSLVVMALLGLCAATRGRRRRALRSGVAAGFLVAPMLARPAVAAPAPPVDVVIEEPAPPRRYVTVAWNPLSLILTRVSFDVVVAPAAHHALVLSPHYFWTETAPIFIYDDQVQPTELPTQRFRGGGVEIGYRYYFGEAGPRGWFIGPSFLLSAITATPQYGPETSYLKLGGALDAGYQILVADRVSINMGLGVQYSANNKDIPKQQYPALVLVNGGLRPRFLASLGWAF